jgi:hypothetical protein
VEITRVDDALREIVTIIDGNMSAASLERIALPEAG